MTQFPIADDAEPAAETTTTALTRSIRYRDALAGSERDDYDDSNVGETRLGLHKQLSNEVTQLREWGAHWLLPLDPLRNATNATDSTALAETGRLALTASRVELVFDNPSWRIKDWNGVARLKQDGRPAHEVTLMDGMEISIAGRTLIAESPRSIALRNFCARLLGWGDHRIAAVDQALRAIRLANSGRAALVLRGAGDLVPVAHTVHRYTLGDASPFVVSDPRRKNTSASVRGPANHRSAKEAFRKAHRGTLCIRSRRPPLDFEEIQVAFRDPECGVQLTICIKDSARATLDVAMLGAGQIAIPSLQTRRSELPRIVGEYIDDALGTLQAPVDCLVISDNYFCRSTTIRFAGSSTSGQPR